MGPKRKDLIVDLVLLIICYALVVFFFLEVLDGENLTMGGKCFLFSAGYFLRLSLWITWWIFFGF